MVCKGLKVAQRRGSAESSAISVSKLHTALSIHKDLLKIYNLSKSGCNLVGMGERFYLTKALLPWSPKSNLFL